TTTNNVGIGTTTPGYKLSLYNSGDTVLNISGNGDNAWISRFANRLHIASNDMMQFGTGGQTDVDMTISSSGNLGIGTASPAYRLEVAGGDLSVSDNSIYNATILDGEFGESLGNILGFAGDKLIRADNKYTVTCDKAPRTGSIAQMFDGNGSNPAEWDNVDLPVTCTIEFNSMKHYWEGIAINFPYGRYVSGVKIEKFYDNSSPWNDCNSGDSSLVWATTYETTTNNKVALVNRSGWGNGVCKIRITLSGTPQYANDIRIGEIAGWQFYYGQEGAFVRVTGGDTIYGSLNVTGTLGVATPTASNHATTKSYVDDLVTGASSKWTVSGTNTYLTATGNKVGIGTTSPIKKVQVNDGLFIGNSFTVTTGSIFTSSNQAQLILGGTHNAGYNIGSNIAKLLITGQDNDGAIIYPIYVEDENGLVDFWLKNRASASVGPTAYFAGNVGIAQLAPTYNLDVSGTGRFTGTVSVGTPTASNHATTKDYVDSMFSGSGPWTLSGTNIYATNTSHNVGIGINSPTGKLHLSGSNQIFTIQSSNADSVVNASWKDNPQIVFNRQGGYTYTGAIGSGIEQGYSGIMNFYVSANTDVRNASNIVMTLSGSRYVGIGTTSPIAKLNISEPTGTVYGANQGSIIIDHENSGGASSIVFRSKVNRGSDYGYIQYQDNSTIGGAGETARLIIGTANDTVDHIILQPSGSVGIGQASPAYKLDVSGTGRFTGTLTGAAAAFSSTVSVGTPASSNHATPKSYVDDLVTGASSKWTTSGTKTYLTTTTNNVGIGTTNPQASLDVPGDFKRGTSYETTVTRVLANTIGAYTEIGTLANTGTANFADFTVYAHNCGTIQALKFSFSATSYVGGVSNTWIELPLDENNSLFSDVQSIAVDVMSPDRSNTSSPVYVRLRAKTAPCGNMNVGVILSTNMVYTETSVSGLGAVVADGYLGSSRWMFPVTNIPWSNTKNGLFILGSGNVGINTTSPAYKLDVNGTARFTGTLTGAAAAFSGTVSVGTPIAGSDAATKSYVDDIFVSDLDLSGDLNMGTNKLTVGTIDPLFNINGKSYA
ncbi:MAG: hypothetical protein PHO36_16620, partial [Parabacteroides sp.]|nr:hypothetical protein [Parabacteroides sp.]